MQVELLRFHEHAGIARNPGEVIDLAEDSAQWLCEIGSARPAAPDSESSAKPSKQSNTTQE
jgi:hypothetical protein